ncbi:MAG: hypothetical protein IH795_11515 [Bacteroidetes bacterium]|nr:hypothetical protein [Bacteroidota bacterium]
MLKQNKNKIIIALIFILILIIAFYGSKIPIVNKIPIFATQEYAEYLFSTCKYFIADQLLGIQ